MRHCTGFLACHLLTSALHHAMHQSFQDKGGVPSLLQEQLQNEKGIRPKTHNVVGNKSQYRGCIRIMEKKLGTTICGLGFRL